MSPTRRLNKIGHYDTASKAEIQFVQPITKAQDSGCNLSRISVRGRNDETGDLPKGGKSACFADKNDDFQLLTRSSKLMPLVFRFFKQSLGPSPRPEGFALKSPWH